MAKARSKREKELFETLRASGLRKKVAGAVADSSRQARRGEMPEVMSKTVENLRGALVELERHAPGASHARSDAAKKSVRTRARNAAKRSASARKGARTRSQQDR